MELEVAILIILMLCIVWCITGSRRKIAVGNREWWVSAKYENAAEASILVDRIFERTMKVLNSMKKRYRVEGATAHAGSDDVKKIVETLLVNFNPDEIYENDPSVSKDTAITYGKGKSILLCVRERKNPNKLIDEEVLFFAVLHELSHIANYSGWGHDTRFWTVFKFVLTEAAIAGQYTPVDYSTTNIDYCGVRITYNPYLDDMLPSLGLPR